MKTPNTRFYYRAPYTQDGTFSVYDQDGFVASVRSEDEARAIVHLPELLALLRQVRDAQHLSVWIPEYVARIRSLAFLTRDLSRGLVAGGPSERYFPGKTCNYSPRGDTITDVQKKFKGQQCVILKRTKSGLIHVALLADRRVTASFPQRDLVI